MTVVIQRTKPVSAQKSSDKIKQGDIKRAILVRAASPSLRSDGRMVRFDDNACILINEKKEPIGSRITSIYSSLYT